MSREPSTLSTYAQCVMFCHAFTTRANKFCINIKYRVTKYLHTHTWATSCNILLALVCSENKMKTKKGPQECVKRGRRVFPFDVIGNLSQFSKKMSIEVRTENEKKKLRKNFCNFLRSFAWWTLLKVEGWIWGFFVRIWVRYEMGFDGDDLESLWVELWGQKN